MARNRKLNPPRGATVEVVRLLNGQPRRLPLGAAEIAAIRHRFPLDDAVAELAAQQRGAVARWQLRAIGLSDEMIDHRVAKSFLQRVFRSVYLVGHTATHPHGLLVAALLVAGKGAALSHFTAAKLWAIRKGLDGVVDVTIAGSRKSRKGLRYHRAKLRADEVDYIDGLPVTTAARTVVDLATLLPREQTSKPWTRR